MNPRRAASLRPGQFKRLIRVATVTGRMPERDVMLLWLTHTTGIRVTELALLEIGDVLYPSGVIKPEVYLRADITKGCRPRNVYLTHARCFAALDAWFEARYQRRWGLSGIDEYRGFRPGKAGHNTQRTSLRTGVQTSPVGQRTGEVYRACDSLQQTISRLYRQADIKQGASHSGRRSLAAKVLAATGDVEIVQTILGHAWIIASLT